MAIKTQSYQIAGMRQDNLVGTGYSTKFAHEIMNMRLNTVGDYTTATWTTEEGTLAKEVTWDVGDNEIKKKINKSGKPIIPVGQAVINDKWIVFCTRDSLICRDIIFKFWYAQGTDDLHGTVLYIGDLNFSTEHPLETLVYYENEDIQKVYWVDGINQPRVININSVNHPYDLDTQFDFVQKVALRENVTITKETSGGGLFPPGTVKYAITYYNKYGQETNIVYDSPLFYPTKGDRACGPDELSGDVFQIRVTHIDMSFDYIRLYSIIRTTENATPIVRIVADKATADTEHIGGAGQTGYNQTTFIDTNTTGRIVDPSILDYVGGYPIIAGTISQKSNTLFLGDITLQKKSALSFLRSLDEDGVEKLRETDPRFTPYELEDGIPTYRKCIAIRNEDTPQGVYSYINQLNFESTNPSTATNIYLAGDSSILNGNSSNIKIFKRNETYRVGIQFQDEYGKWSDVIFLKDITNSFKPIRPTNTNIVHSAYIKYELDGDLNYSLSQGGYKKARLVCCYPNNLDRTTIYQGVLNPTIYNIYEREHHTPDVMASWFFRPNDSQNFLSGTTFNRNAIPWQHNERLDGKHYIDYEGGDSNRKIYETIPEILSSLNTLQFIEGSNTVLTVTDGVVTYKSGSENDTIYAVDRNILTLNSPDLEFDESLRTLPSETYKVDLIGTIPINSFAASLYVDASSPSLTLNGGIGTGLAANFVSYSYSGNRLGSHETSLGEWKDTNLYQQDGTYTNTPYCIYPFHRANSLNNYIRDIDNWEVLYDGSNTPWPIKQSSKLYTKVLSHILYSGNTQYSNVTTRLDTFKCSIFDSNESISLQIDAGPNNSNEIYYGNVSDIVPFLSNTTSFKIHNNDDVTVSLTGIYPLWTYQTRGENSIKGYFNGVYGDDLDDDDYKQVYSSDPIKLTYKSTPHIVFKLQNDAILDYTVPQTRPFLYLAEISRDVVNPFGGEDENVYNLYVPCGPAVRLDNTSQSKTLYGFEGDSYYMRYDCLKTYPYTLEDTNQIVEILSFMCETRINLDGRWDNNRGLLDNTSVTNTNFNYINKSYTQSNNFFTYTTLDSLSASLDKFPNQITWTKTKISGEEVDIWTNLTLANTADADGSYGKISKIINYKDNLLCFQDHGIAQIGYNEKTILSTDKGLPPEIVNSEKFSGLNYLSKEVGCQNKWSINSSKNGVMFIDDSRQELISVDEKLTSLSTLYGFDAFLIKTLPNSEHFKPWTSINSVNFVTFYDKLGNDIFYINKDYCLAWNEQSGSFTSFYSYNNISLMANIGTHLLIWNTPLYTEICDNKNHNCLLPDDNPTSTNTTEAPLGQPSNQPNWNNYSISSNVNIWAARENPECCNFFGTYKRFWMTLVCDGSTSEGSMFTLDKVFYTMEYRADVFDRNASIPRVNINLPVFDKIAAYNGYQVYKEFDIDSIRKFNIWRAELPRATYMVQQDDDYVPVTTRDRVRNPFCYIKLLNTNTTHLPNRVIIHDLLAYFDVK